MNRNSLLKRAAEHFFSTGLGDGASSLCRENMSYGLAKTHSLQEHFGLEPNATFVSTPDETITKNVHRWKSGFGYGGKLTWGSGKDKIIILETKPNACGMLLGGLSELPDIKQLIQNIKNLKEIYIDNLRLNWDCNKGNHFIDIFKVINKSDQKISDYAFIIHSSVSELQGETEKGIGLYMDKSQNLQDRSKIVETAFGPLHAILDSDAEEYLKFYRYAEQFSREKRNKIANEIFGNFTEIANLTHQGLLNYNTINLGCYDITNTEAKVFPIALRADLPAFLMKGLENLNATTIEKMGFKERAEKLGVLDRLTKANILPHGGGYTFHNFKKVKEVLEVENERYYVITMKTDNSNLVCSNPRDLEYCYRGKSVIKKSLKLGLGEITAQLNPHQVIKI